MPKGHVDAEISLGFLYDNGRGGVKQDYAEAYFWEQLGIRSGGVILNDYPGGPAAMWAKHLTPEQQAAVEKRIEEWMKTHPAPASK